MEFKSEKHNKLIGDGLLAVKARWIFVLSMIFIGVATKVSGVANIHFAFWLMGTFFCIACFYNFLCFYLLKIKGKKISENFLQAFIFIQFVVDTFLITAVIHFAGGIESISFIFYFFLIVLASFIYNEPGVLLVSFVAAFFYDCLVFGEYFGLFRHIPRYVFSLSNIYLELDVILINSLTVSVVLLSIGFFAGHLSRIRNKKEEEVFEEKNKRIKEIEKLEKDKSQFISILSHQLRTPLTHIRLTLAELLERKAFFDAEQNKLLEDSWLSAQKMVDLLKRLFDMVELEEKKIVLKMNQVCLNEIIEKAITSLSFLADYKKMPIVSNIRSLKKIIILGDASLLQFVVEALLQNALDYGEEGKEIVANLSSENNIAKIEVRNTGIAISEEAQEKIFNKFFRSPEAVRLVPDRSGLSLYLVRMVLEKHKGTIILETKTKEAAFYITLPLAV